MPKKPFPKITSPEIRAYCELHSSKQNVILDQLEIRSQSTYDPGMISGPFLGRFISMISIILRPQYILEVGTFTGYGSLCLSEGLHPEGQLITIEKDPKMKGFNGEHSHIIQHIGDASDIIPQLDYVFDLVFIDAAKRKYIEHFDLILPKVRSGGIILADNVLWKGKVVTEENDNLGKGLDAFNKYVVNHDSVENIIIPLDDGVNMIIKK